MHEVSEHFTSLAALVEADETRKPRGDVRKRSSRREDPSRSWEGTKNITEARQWATDGIPNAADLIEATAVNLDRLRLMNDGNRATIRRAHVGGSINAARAARNLPKQARRIEHKPKQAPKITLVYDSAALSNESAHAITQAGARVLACVKEAERQGARVELVAACATEWGSRERIFMSATIRNAAEPLNIAQAAFALTCPSFQRRLGFSWRETNKNIMKWRNGYGHSLCSGTWGQREARDHFREAFGDGTVFTSFYAMDQRNGLTDLWRAMSAAISGETSAARM